MPWSTCVSVRIGLPNKGSLLGGYGTHILILPRNRRLGGGNGNIFAEFMEKQVPAVWLVAQGSNGSGWMNWLVTHARTTPMIILRNTGGCADVVAQSVINRRQGADRAIQLKLPDGDKLPLAKRAHMEKEDISVWSLPSFCRESQFIILDANVHTSEAVVEKIIQSVTLVEDDEARLLGSAQAEASRLLRAWTMYHTYRHSAQMHLHLSHAFHYTILCISLATTTAAVTHSQHAILEIEASAVEALGWLVSILPLLSAFLLSCNSRFSPRTKWSQLEVASHRVLDEIYQYRARVAEYAPRFSNRLTSPPGGPPIATGQTADQHTSARSSTRTSESSQSDSSGGGAEQSGDMEKKSKMLRSRREVFATALEDIQSEIRQGEFRDSAMRVMDENTVRNHLQQMQTMQQVRQHRSNSSKVSPLEGGREDLTGERQGKTTHSLSVHCDDGFSPLNSEDYIKFRLDPTLEAFHRKAPKLQLLLTIIQTLVFLCTGLNAILALMTMTEWMPVVVAVTSFLAGLSEYQMLSTKLHAVNGAILSLENLLVWWESLSMVQKRQPEAKEYLVKTTEEAVSAEIAWAKSVSKKRQPRTDDVNDKSKQE